MGRLEYGVRVGSGNTGVGKGRCVLNKRLGVVKCETPWFPAFQND